MIRPLRSFTLSLLALFLFSCDHHTDAVGVNPDQRITLKGRVVSSTLARAGSAATAAKVLVYRDFGDADISLIGTDGSFSVDAKRRPCGLVFLSAADSVIGVLSLAAGIDALPLSLVGESVTLLNLKDITITAGTGTPQHNPIDAGGEAVMTAEERAAYRLQSAFFNAILRNLDMDRDGVIDVLSPRKYWMRFGSDFDGGTAMRAEPGTAAPLPKQNVFHFNFSDGEPPVSQPVAVLSAPDGKSFLCHEASMNDFTQYHWVLQNTAWSSFLGGAYAIDYAGGRRVEFTIASPLQVENYIVAAHLWYEMEGNTITRVHWRWRMLNGAPIDAARLIAKQVILQFNYNGFSSQKNYQVTSADTQCDVSVDTTNLMQILVSCNDLFGNWQPTFYGMR